MDGAIKTNRAFPAYTTAQLKDCLKSREVMPLLRAKIAQEIAAREAGISKPFVTPQI